MSRTNKRRKIEPGLWRTQYGRYQVHYRDTAGNQRSKTFERLVDARDFKAEVRRGPHRFVCRSEQVKAALR